MVFWNCSTPPKTSISYPIQVDYLPSEYLPTGSSLAITQCPGRNKSKWKRDLTADLTRIRDVYKGQTIVTLVRSEELNRMGIDNYFEILGSETFKMKSFHFPIADKWLPASIDEFCKMIDFIISELMQQRNVICHCNGGKGRAATTCVATLLALKISKNASCNKYVTNAVEAISIVRTTRGSGTLQNPLQIIWLRTKFPNYYSRHWKRKNTQLE
jgi:protein-tyrosine phosphatase